MAKMERCIRVYLKSRDPYTLITGLIKIKKQYEK